MLFKSSCSYYFFGLRYLWMLSSLFLDQVPDLVFSPAPYSTNTTSKIQSNRNTHPTQYQTAPINSIENEVHKNNGILKRNSEIDDLKCTPTKKIQIKDSQQPTKDTSTASLLKALKTSPSLRKELSESLTETSLLQVCGGDEEMARKLLAELSSQNKTPSVSFSSTSSSLSKTTPIDSRYCYNIVWIMEIKQSSGFRRIFTVASLLFLAF